MPELVTDNLKIYYESLGEGDPIILIRGLGSNADHWYAQIPDLSKHYRVITFDNRGIARSSDPGGPFTIKDMANDTLALMDGLGIERTHLLGLSMGGMIAQEVAISDSHRIQGLILVVTHCGGEQYIRPEKAVAESIQRLAEDDSLEARVVAAAAFFSPQTLKKKQHVLEEYAGVSSKYPTAPALMKRQLDAIAEHDTYDRLDRINAKTLVLSGSEDVLIPPENSRILAKQISGAQMHVIPDCGHQVMIEAAQACNRKIIDFLQMFPSR